MTVGDKEGVKTPGERINKVLTYTVVALFLVAMPVYVLYDIVVAPVVEKVKAVKIDKNEFINVDDDGPDIEIDSSVLKVENPVPENNSVKAEHPVLLGENDNGGPNDGSRLSQWYRSNKELVYFIYSMARRDKDKALEKALDSVANYNRKFSGKLKGEKVTILITGLDSRFGSNTSHADANHLVTVYFETGFIQIVSVPRGTYADAGFPDTSENYLANVRSNRGQRIYMSEVSRITGVRKIDYYVEFGFSQAIGLMELLGYKSNAVQMLRMLRHRKSFSGGDVQRCYNQGQFIRQMILGFFPIVTGATGEVILRAGLYLVRTDLDMATVKLIIEKLQDKGFPKSKADVMVTIKPQYRAITNNYDFGNETSRDSLYKRLTEFAAKIGIKDKPNDPAAHSEDVYNKLNQLIRQLKYAPPDKVVEILRRLYEQKIWFQVIDIPKRIEMRNKLSEVLIAAYNSLKNRDEAEKIKLGLKDEDELLNK